ncbi:MAG: formyltransferase family protein [Planctomycetota bacterium]
MEEQTPRIALAANRHLGYQALHTLLDAGITPCAVLLAKGRSADQWADQMEQTVRNLDQDVPVIRGKQFREPEGITQIQAIDPDYIVSVHFPYIVPAEVLAVPRIGTLNLHPAYLPYNRGWHTPSWAIADGTPYGATLHWMDEGVDTGDIALQRQVRVLPDDTADSLYQRVLEVELEVFREAIPYLSSRTLPRLPQAGRGTAHSKRDLANRQQLALDRPQTIRQTIRTLRALTTNSWDEAAYFEQDGVKYRVQVVIQKEEIESQQDSARKAA